jgi:hypothetical protein
VLSFTLLPLYLRYPLGRRFGALQNWFGRRGKEKFFPYRVSNSEPSAVPVDVTNGKMMGKIGVK